MGPLFLVKLWGPYLNNYSFLSPPTFLHKPRDSPKITEIVVLLVGRDRVAIPLDRSLTPSANIAIPAKGPYPPERSWDPGSLPLLGGSSQDL